MILRRVSVKPSIITSNHVQMTWVENARVCSQMMMGQWLASPHVFITEISAEFNVSFLQNLDTMLFGLIGKCHQTWWRHGIDTLLAHWEGNHRTPMGLPHKRPMMWNFAVFIVAFPIKLLNKPSSCRLLREYFRLWRHQWGPVFDALSHNTKN